MSLLPCQTFRNNHTSHYGVSYSTHDWICTTSIKSQNQNQSADNFCSNKKMTQVEKTLQTHPHDPMPKKNNTNNSALDVVHKYVCLCLKNNMWLSNDIKMTINAAAKCNTLVCGDLINSKATCRNFSSSSISARLLPWGSRCCKYGFSQCLIVVSCFVPVNSPKFCMWGTIALAKFPC